MSATLATALYLHPVLPEWSADEKTIIDALRSLGMIDKPIASLDNSFFVGPSFLSHVLFLGCSPAIQFDADAGEDFTFIRLMFYENPKLIHTVKQSRAPHCPQCNKRFEQWNDMNITKAWQCPHCKAESRAHQYNWKRTAGLARVFIEITQIYPKEAIPQTTLLQQLHSLTGVEWDYFYYCV